MKPLRHNWRGSVSAPARYGKTHAIVEVVKLLQDKPALILTHTNAGVYALRDRLQKEGVPRTAFTLTTRSEHEINTTTDLSQLRSATLFFEHWPRVRWIRYCLPHFVACSSMNTKTVTSYNTSSSPQSISDRPCGYMATICRRGLGKS